jgi:hypothetical protein
MEFTDARIGEVRHRGSTSYCFINVHVTRYTRLILWSPNIFVGDVVLTMNELNAGAFVDFNSAR